MTKKLTPKQIAFVNEYLVDLNATQAAIRAGYSKKTARSQGQRLLTNVDVAAAIQERQAKRSEKVEVTQEYVLKRMLEIDNMDAADILADDGSVLPVKEWPKVWRQFLSGYDIVQMSSQDDVMAFIKKIRWPDKIRNLELIGKHLGMFTEKVEVDVGSNLASAIIAARGRAKF